MGAGFRPSWWLALFSAPLSGAVGEAGGTRVGALALVDGVGEEHLGHAVEERGELADLVGGPVGEGHAHADRAGIADAVDGLLTGGREADAQGTAVTGVGDPGDVAGLLQLLDLAGDMGGLDVEATRQLPGRSGSESATWRNRATAARSSGTPARAISRSCCRALVLR